MDKLRPIYGALLVWCCLVCWASTAGAQEQVSFWHGGQELQLDNPPLWQEGRLLIPLRSVFSRLGAEVDWDGGNKRVTITQAAITVALTIDSPVAQVNGQRRALDGPPVLYQDRTYIPLRFVLEALGYPVHWNADARTVLIGDQDVDGNWQAPLPEDEVPEELPVVIEQPAKSQKRVCLTFDDGPSANLTPQVLDILAQQQVPATFFVIGCNAEREPDLIRRIVTEGHALGNHTYSHAYQEIYASPKAYLDSVRQAGAVLARITGDEPAITRAPGGTYGHFTGDYYHVLRENGYCTFDWNVSTGDSALPRPTVEQILANIATYSRNGTIKEAVVLMHDSPTHETTVAALPQLIAFFQEYGYVFEVLTPAHPLAK